MKTVLLWGRQWWLDDASAPVSFDNLMHAADALAAHWANREKPSALRLVYQPDDLVTVSSPCPQGNRAMLAQALGDEHPALTAVGLAWSFEPILPAKPRFETLLHYETTPALFALVEALRARGFAVDSVWPLATWLNALPQDWPDNGAVTVCALSANRAAVYRHGADGARGFHTWTGEKALAELGTFLAKIFAQNAAEFVLFVPTKDDVIQRLESVVSFANRTGVHALSLRAALAQAATMPRKHPAQMLPPAPWFTPSDLALVASVALLAAAGVASGLYLRDALALRAQGATRAEQKQTLRAEVAHLRANEAEIVQLRAALQAAKAHGQPWATTLRQLGQTLPPEITFTALRLQPNGFAVQGFVAPGAPNGWGDWLARLASKEAPWHLQPASAPDTAGRFVLTGQLGS
ncbi:MAG: hypothetical protein EXS38_07970 [Opitutus sp.]|nr:hypothetical protein [Opitutus sp.]